MILALERGYVSTMIQSDIELYDRGIVKGQVVIRSLRTKGAKYVILRQVGGTFF